MYQLNQNYRQVFVLLGSSILAQGTTVDLALGQIGFFDGKTYSATTNPTYANNKALIIAQGRLDFSDLTGGLQMHLHGHSDKTKVIKGKSIIDFRGFKARRGQNEVVTIGYDGINDCKTLSAKCGELLTVYIRLTGYLMTKWFGQDGIIRQYTINTKCCSGCDADTCEDVCAIDLAEELAKMINEDKVLYKTLLSQFIKAEVIKKCTLAIVLAVGISFTKYCLETCDNGDGIVLGQIQTQYLGYTVVRSKREGSTSSYEMWRKTSDGALSSVTIKNNFITDCLTCLAGSTLQSGLNYYEVTREDERANLSSAIATSYGVLTSAVVKIAENYGEGTYIVQSANSLTPSGTDSLKLISKGRDVCVLLDTTLAWTSCDVCEKFSKKYCLTLGNKCDTDRLSDIQKAYLDLVITKRLLLVGTLDCGNVYETEVLSSLVCKDCNTEDVATYVKLALFESFEWDECPCDVLVAFDCTDCVAGVKLTSAFVDRETNDCMWELWHPCKDYDGIHIEASCANYDYNSDPCVDCKLLVTKLQQFEYLQGTGCYVRKWEIDTQMYELRFWNGSREVMDAERYQLFSDLNKFYDQYDLLFEFKYLVLGWSDKYTDTYTVTFFVPEGQGKQLESVINGYLASAAIDIDLVIL